MPAFAARRERLLQVIVQEGLDAVLTTSPVNVTWLTGFAGDSSYILLSKDKALLISDGRFTEQIAQDCPDVDTYIRPTNQLLPDAAAAQIDGLGIASLGFESNHLTVAEFEELTGKTKGVSWKAGKDRVETMRQIKDDGEIAQIRASIRFAEKAFAMLRATMRPDDTEKDLADALEQFIRRAGGKQSSFPIIVAVGARAALPHALPDETRLSEAPLVLFDWGASGPFYKSDLTRVLWSNNNATATDSSTLRKVFTSVHEAQRRAIGMIRPGVLAREVDAAARGSLAEAGYGDYFNHGSGHGLGLQIHEAPFLRPNSDAVLQAGMVITIEPGVYLPGWGGVRIEDDVLVTPDGAEVLTRYPRDFDASYVEF